MAAITQQDTPQTETPKLQHITTTNRPQPLQHQYYRISSTRFHTSAQETVGSGALVSAWLFLGNTIPLPRWQRMELFRQKFRQGKISPPFLTAKFSLRNSPLAQFSLPLYHAMPRAAASGYDLVRKASGCRASCLSLRLPPRLLQAPSVMTRVKRSPEDMRYAPAPRLPGPIPGFSIRWGQCLPFRVVRRATLRAVPHLRREEARHRKRRGPKGGGLSGAVGRAIGRGWQRVRSGDCQPHMPLVGRWGKGGSGSVTGWIHGKGAPPLFPMNPPRRAGVGGGERVLVETLSVVGWRVGQAIGVWLRVCSMCHLCAPWSRT